MLRRKSRGSKWCNNFCTVGEATLTIYSIDCHRQTDIGSWTSIKLSTMIVHSNSHACVLYVLYGIICRDWSVDQDVWCPGWSCGDLVCPGSFPLTSHFVMTESNNNVKAFSVWALIRLPKLKQTLLLVLLHLRFSFVCVGLWYAYFVL